MDEKTNARWLTWWQTDLPCYFSQERANENCEFLISLLGRDWLQRGAFSPGTANHPLLQRWVNDGAGSFIELNTLAEDLRILAKVPHLDTLIDDLRISALCLPTWHTIHSAALFERETTNSVLNFFPQNDQTSPDFLLLSAKNEIPVEAKLLTESSIEADFNLYSESLVNLIKTEIMVDKALYPVIVVVIKNCKFLPKMEEVSQSTRDMLRNYKTGHHEQRYPLFNISIGPPFQDTSNLNSYKCCFILCPASENEEIRVLSRAKKASKQLAAYNPSVKDGILCLGMQVHQNPHRVKELLEREFNRGRFDGLTQVYLMRTGTVLEPPQRSTVDLISVVRNTQKIPTDKFNIKFHSVHFYGSYFEHVKPDPEMSIYKNTSAEVEFKELKDGCEIVLPKISTLYPQELN